MSKLLTNTLIYIISIFSFNNAYCQCILNFDSKQSVSKWKTINDDVMGGVSTSDVRYNNNDYAIFSGNISLENNVSKAKISQFKRKALIIVGLVPPYS